MRIGQLPELEKELQDKDLLEVQSGVGSFKLGVKKLFETFKMKLNLAKVAFSGDFYDLSNIPKFEGVSQAYVDEQDGKTLRLAKEYVDESIPSLEDYATKVLVEDLNSATVQSTKNYTDSKSKEAEQKAKAYTDSKVVEVDLTPYATKSEVSASASSALQSSKNYTDQSVASGVSESKQYTDKSITDLNLGRYATKQEVNNSVTTSVNASGNYTNIQVAAAEQRAKNYTDSKIVDVDLSEMATKTDVSSAYGNAVRESKQYTDNTAVETLSAAKAYTDNYFTGGQEFSFATELFVASSITAFGNTLHPVAKNGDYYVLNNRPVLGTAASRSASEFATASQGARADTAVQPTDIVHLATKVEVEGKVDKVDGFGLSEESFSSTEKTKLAGVEEGAQVNVGTDLSVKLNTASITVESSTGSNVNIPEATPTKAGVFGVKDKTKLDGVAAEATKNATDDFLLSRDNHTGVQAISTVEGLQMALDSKVVKEAGKGLSSNDFTSAEKEKLASLESSMFRGTFTSLAALEAGVTNPVAGNYANVDGGEGVKAVLYIYDATDMVWVAQQSEVAPLTSAEIKQKYEENPDTNAFTDADKAKLDGIEAGAEKNLPTDLSRSVTSTKITILSSTGGSTIIPAASTSGAGVMVSEDKKKLDSVEEGAQKNVPTNLIASRGGDTVSIQSSTGTNATIRAATDTFAGVLEATDKRKLDGIQAEATKNSTDAELKNRANHTGTQPVSSVTGLQGILDTKLSGARDNSRVTDFTAVVGTIYWLTEPITVTLPTTGLQNGDFVSFACKIGVSPVVQCTLPIKTTVGEDTDILLDIPAEVKFIWNGSNWEV